MKSSWENIDAWENYFRWTFSRPWMNNWGVLFLFVLLWCMWLVTLFTLMFFLRVGPCLFPKVALPHQGLCTVKWTGVPFAGSGHPAPDSYGSILISVQIDSFLFFFIVNIWTLIWLNFFIFCFDIHSHNKNMLPSFICCLNGRETAMWLLARLTFPEVSTVLVEIKCPSCKHWIKYFTKSKHLFPRNISTIATQNVAAQLIEQGNSVCRLVWVCVLPCAVLCCYGLLVMALFR